MRKPRLSFWQIWNMSFGFLGIQFGFALQNGNVSRIFETLGANIDAIPILWIAAPVTGLLVQPIIGHMSDKTWGRLGRRRPYFLAGAILASAALFIMPSVPVLWMAAGMLWILDASINVAMEPFRAFVGDMLPSDQRTTGFAMQSFFIGVGAVVASALPYALTNWFGVANTATAGAIPDSVKWSFYLGGVVFLLAVVWTVIRSREYTPDELRAYDAGEHARAARIHQHAAAAPASVFYRRALVWSTAGALACAGIYGFELAKELYILAIGLVFFGVVQFVSGVLVRQGRQEAGVVSIISDLYTMPKTMAQLAVVQFFSWLALFAMWIYTTAAVTSHIYGTSDATSTLYNEGANWVGILFAVYNGVAALAAFLLPAVARRTSRKVTHMLALTFGGIGLASVYAIQDPMLLILSMIGVGIAWASILSMPYAMLTGALPSHKMGTYMGIFNFFIVIPQILAASILGFFVRTVFSGEAIYVLLLGGASMVIAGLVTLLVDDVDDVQVAAPEVAAPSITKQVTA